MRIQERIDFERIAAAIQYITDHFKTQPSLDEVAAHVNLSPFHFQRLFTAWAGASPKQFLQYTSAAYAKKLLKEGQASLFETAAETGFSGTGRLHDLFVQIEAMTPGEYKNGGEGLLIQYSFASTPFGEIIIASTDRGICHIAFVDDETLAAQTLNSHFPKAAFQQKTNSFHEAVKVFFVKRTAGGQPIQLHLKGTDFQLKVWEALLKIPMGRLGTYGDIAGMIDSPKASRAVGSAIGANPVAYLIPCHRVIRSTGVFGGYMWGGTRKTAIIGWEAAATDLQIVGI